MNMLKIKLLVEINPNFSEKKVATPGKKHKINKSIDHKIQIIESSIIKPFFRILRIINTKVKKLAIVKNICNSKLITSF